VGEDSQTSIAILPPSWREVPMPVVIVKNRIDGLRITVYDVLHYLQAGRSHEEIADILPLTPEQVEAAVRYIEEHHDEVMAEHQRIEERLARGNPPEVEAHAKAGRARMEALRRGKGAVVCSSSSKSQVTG
jgi:uncharacterized protein (DUF433 family)